MNDTHPDIERRQIEMIRSIPDDRKAAIASELRNRTYWLARRALDERHPDLSEWHRKLLFIHMHYGSDLADRVRADWITRGYINA